MSHQLITRLLLPFCLTTLLLAGCAGMLPDAGYDAYMEAATAYDAKNFPLAEVKYQEILDKKLCTDEENTNRSGDRVVYFCYEKTLYYLGWAYAQDGQQEKAIQHLEAFVNTDVLSFMYREYCVSRGYLLEHYTKTKNFSKADDNIFRTLNLYDKIRDSNKECASGLLVDSLTYATAAGKTDLPVNYYREAYYKAPSGPYAYPFRKALIAAQNIKQVNNITAFETEILAPIQKWEKIQQTTFGNEQDPAYIAYLERRATIFRNALFAAEKKGITGYDGYLAQEAKSAMQSAANLRAAIVQRQQPQYSPPPEPAPSKSGDDILMNMFNIILQNSGR